MKTRIVSLAAAAACLSFAAQSANSELIRFIQIIKNETPDTRFHLGELEAFENGVAPNDLGGGSFGGLATSTNDIGDGQTVTYGAGNVLPAVGTATSIATCSRTSTSFSMAQIRTMRIAMVTT